jgi:NADPH:quinone reductase
MMWQGQGHEMKNMKAIAIREPGGPEVLVPVEIARPVVGEGQLLVEVAAAGVNRPDILQRQGGYPPPAGAPLTPGLEIAGKVVAIGEGCKRFGVGEHVCALVPGGGYAEYCIAAEDNALPIPHGLTLIEAAGLPETYFTVWTNVFERGGLKAGEIFLVHGGSSGIGSTAIMLAKAFGAIVIATAGSEEKCKACLQFGADHAINYRKEDFVTALRAKGLAPDLILDMVGGDYVERNLKVAALHGRIVQIAFQQGSRITADLLPIMLKKLTFTGSTLRPRSIAEKASIARALEKNVWPLLAQGRCKPRVHVTFPLAKAAEAHTLMETSVHVGKIILTVGS